MEINKIQIEQLNEITQRKLITEECLNKVANDNNYLNNLQNKVFEFVHSQTDDETEIENFDLSDLDNLNPENAENNELINPNKEDIQKLHDKFGNISQYINQKKEALLNELTAMEKNVQEMLEQMYKTNITKAKKQPDAFKKLHQQAVKMLENLHKLCQENPFSIKEFGNQSESDFETKYNNLLQKLIEIINYTGAEIDGNWIRISTSADEDNSIANFAEKLSTINNANDKDNIIAEFKKIIKS